MPVVGGKRLRFTATPPLATRPLGFLHMRRGHPPLVVRPGEPGRDHVAGLPRRTVDGLFNPLLAEKRRQKRERLLAATEENLTKLARDVALRTKAPLSAAEIGVKAGQVVGRHKMAKHIRLTIRDYIFTLSHDE